MNLEFTLNILLIEQKIQHYSAILEFQIQNKPAFTLAFSSVKLSAPLLSWIGYKVGRIHYCFL